MTGKCKEVPLPWKSFRNNDRNDSEKIHSMRMQYKKNILKAVEKNTDAMYNIETEGN